MGRAVARSTEEARKSQHWSVRAPTPYLTASSSTPSTFCWSSSMGLQAMGRRSRREGDRETAAPSSNLTSTQAQAFEPSSQEVVDSPVIHEIEQQREGVWVRVWQL